MKHRYVEAQSSKQQEKDGRGPVQLQLFECVGDNYCTDKDGKQHGETVRIAYDASLSVLPLPEGIC